MQQYTFIWNIKMFWSLACDNIYEYNFSDHFYAGVHCLVIVESL